MSNDQSSVVHVDPDRCQGHNRCKLVAPALFVLDANGYAHPAGDGHVAADQLEEAKLARANCPEHAVSLRRTVAE
jgi:ferredoxin